MKTHKLRRWFVLVGLLALTLVAIFNFGYLSQFVALAHRIRWYVLALVIAVQVWSYYNNAKFYQAMLKIFGYEVNFKRLYRSALALNFVNQVFPSGGLSGVSYLSTVFHGDVPAGKMTLAQLMRYVFTLVSFMGVLIVGFVLLFVSGDVDQVTARLTLIVIFVIILAGLVAALIIADRTRLQWTVHKVVDWVNNVAAKILRRRKKSLIARESVEHFFDEFYEGYSYLAQAKGQWKRPLCYALGGNLAEVITLYIVFVALGQVVNPGIVIAAYTLANILSVAAVVTGGIGLYEATMVGAFTALGVPFASAFAAVLVYRFFNFVIFLPIGFYYYRQQI
jgi:uncharacterized protein (TIRG00374 family)